MISIHRNVSISSLKTVWGEQIPHVVMVGSFCPTRIYSLVTSSPTAKLARPWWLMALNPPPFFPMCNGWFWFQTVFTHKGMCSRKKRSFFRKKGSVGDSVSPIISRWDLCGSLKFWFRIPIKIIELRLYFGFQYAWLLTKIFVLWVSEPKGKDAKSSRDQIHP